MMDWAALPPLSALRAFSALAENGSTVAAGAQLNVSHAAISQQVKSLEARIGVRLVDRTGRQLALTTEGRQLADALKVGFGTIARTVEALNGADAERPLHISTTPMFAAAWLMPQLAGFHTEHPGANLIVSTTPEVQQLDPGGIDLALRYGDGRWPGLEAELVFASPMVVVAAPSLMKARKISGLSSLSDLPLLQDIGVSESTSWLVQEGAMDGRSGAVMQLPGNLLLDAARDGRGLAVVIRAFVENDIKAGRLRLLLENDNNKGYYIVTRPGVQRAATKTFLKWLRKCVHACISQK